MITSIDHINIVVNNLDESIKFYTEVMGFKLSRRMILDGEWVEKIVGLDDVEAEVAFIELESGPRIELLQYIQPEGESVDVNSFPNTKGLRHIAFNVDNMNEFVERLKANGIWFVNDPVLVPDHILPHSSHKKSLCYFFDPDRVLLELAAYESDVDD